MAKNKYVDIQVLNYAVQSLGQAITNTFSMKKNTITSIEIVQAIPLGETEQTYCLRITYDDNDTATPHVIDLSLKDLLVTEGVSIKLLDKLPAVADAVENTLYIIPGTGGNLLEEYILKDGVFEKVGGSSLDLSDYVKGTDLVNTLKDYAKKSDVPSITDVNTLKTNLTKMQTTVTNQQTSITNLDKAAIKGFIYNGKELPKSSAGKVTLDISDVLQKDIANAARVTFDNTTAPSIVSKNVQGALNEVERRVVSLESADKIDEAFEIQFDSKISQMKATNVQQAIDEIDNRLDNWIMDSSQVSYNGVTLDKVIAQDIANLANITAEKVGYSDLMTKYGVKNVQAALDMLYKDIQAIVYTNLASGITYDNKTSKLKAEEVQSAIDEVLAHLIQTDKNLQATDDKITKITQSFDSAYDVKYDNTASKLKAVNVQDALDEIDASLDNALSRLKTAETTITNHGTAIINLQNATKDLGTIRTTLTSTTKIATDNKTILDKLNSTALAGFSINTNGDLTYNGALIAVADFVFHGNASEVTYNNKDTNITNTKVQGAITELDTRLAKVEAPTAAGTSYDPKTSKLNATTVQGAIDALDATLDSTTKTLSTATTNIGTLQTDVSNLKKAPAQTAKDEKYDNTVSKLTATNTNDAIDELAAKCNAIVDAIDDAASVDFDNAGSGLTSTNVQDALVEILNKIPTKIAQLSYDNSESGLDATTGQTAIDELASSGGGGGSSEGGESGGGGGAKTYVIKAADYEYTGLGATSRTLTFDYIPEVVFISRIDNSGAARHLILHYGSLNAIMNYSDGTNTQGGDYRVDVTYSQDWLTATLKSYNASRAMDIKDVKYKVTYLYKLRISTGGGSGSGGGGGTAADTDFDYTISNFRDENNMPIDNVQNGMDELIKYIKAIWAKDEELSNAKGITYDSPFTSLTSTNVEEALDELDNKFNSLNGADAKNVRYDNTSSGVDSITVQNAIDRIFATMDQLVADYYYVKPKITSFTASIDTDKIYEIGTKLTNVKLTWTTNKTIVEQTLTDFSPGADARTVTIEGPIENDKTYTLTITDSEGATDTAEVTFNFGLNVYWGGAEMPATTAGYDSDFCLKLANKAFKEEIQGEYPMALQSGKYGYIIYPFDYSVISRLLIDYTTVEPIYVTTFKLTNSSGYEYAYNVYRTENTGLGNITLRVL